MSALFLILILCSAMTDDYWPGCAPDPGDTLGTAANNTYLITAQPPENEPATHLAVASPVFLTLTVSLQPLRWLEHSEACTESGQRVRVFPPLRC